ncbi:MAG: DUF1667 domain-containing protein [Clostridia bacterium]|nr:DUF1667 domain-containing protein [Clostridia bacterium]MBR3996972.1 DUF1667 domain-containing protein [Clostridia bacterium]
MTKELTCVVCPAGCPMTVTLDENGNVISVTGNTCARGKKYAESEITHPVRTLTSTVTVLANGVKQMCPVRVDKPIPKETMFDAMKIIRGLKVNAPVKTGDVICADFIEEGTNLIACKDFE